MLIRSLISLLCLMIITTAGIAQKEAQEKTVLQAAFVCLPGVYNSELMAPYDILQHSIYRDTLNYIACYVVTPDGKPFITSEGITIVPHYSFANAPDADILIIPSTEKSMSEDLQNVVYMNWIKNTAEQADYVMTLCDGAFPLAGTGLLDGRVATTFPGDRASFKEMFPAIQVRELNFVVDGKYITSVGGALSYEPALWLLEHLYSAENARRTAKGMVLDWQLSEIPHEIVQQSSSDKSKE